MKYLPTNTIEISRQRAVVERKIKDLQLDDNQLKSCAEGIVYWELPCLNHEIISHTCRYIWLTRDAMDLKPSSLERVQLDKECHAIDLWFQGENKRPTTGATDVLTRYLSYYLKDEETETPSQDIHKVIDASSKNTPNINIDPPANTKTQEPSAIDDKREHRRDDYWSGRDEIKTYFFPISWNTIKKWMEPHGITQPDNGPWQLYKKVATIIKNERRAIIDKKSKKISDTN